MANKYPELKDQDPMPFGEHVGKPMEDVPASRLLWMWNDGLRKATKEDSKRGTIARYIKANIKVLQEQDPDTIVDDEV